MGTETTTDVEELESYGPWGTISGWWLTYLSEKYEFVSWDYNIPN
jgi:hypothetical protein